VRRQAKDLLRRGWRVAHRLAPGVAERVDDRRRARLRSARAVAGAVQHEERLAAVERELELISKQVAVLTMRLEQSPTPTGAAGADEAARLLKARLGAISFYEERISRLETAAGLAVPSSGDTVPAGDSPR
jgi:hypothetical protein